MDFRRYAPDSVRFSDAKPGSFADLKVGDQLRVLGEKNADGTRIKAEAIVSGSFRNIAGVIKSIDASAKRNHAHRSGGAQAGDHSHDRGHGHAAVAAVDGGDAGAARRRGGPGGGGDRPSEGVPGHLVPRAPSRVRAGPPAEQRRGSTAAGCGAAAMDFQDMLERMPPLTSWRN